MTDDTRTGDAPLDVDPHGAGVWAQDVEVVLGVHEVTLDFVRVDHESGRRYLAARVALPLLPAVDLGVRLDELRPLWGTRTGRIP